MKDLDLVDSSVFIIEAECDSHLISQFLLLSMWYHTNCLNIIWELVRSSAS